MLPVLTRIKRFDSRIRRAAKRIRSFLRPFNRESVARTFLKGNGLEIGALNRRLAVPKGARVKYVDRTSNSDLWKHYFTLDIGEFARPDIIDDGERLGSIRNGSQDFVIANHFLEHCQNPLGALENMLRVLKSEGILYLALPDKRYTFDAERPVTPLDHILRDYREGPAWSRAQHFHEWTRLVNKTTDEPKASEETAHLMNIDYSIHYHVWTQAEMLELFATAKRMFPFEIELIVRQPDEVIFILKKTP